MSTTKLGAVLKQRRKELRLTLAQVGAALGLANGNFIGMVERGERAPSDERLLELAKVLRLDGRELLATKFRDARGAVVARVLLEPPPAELPRLRRLLLATCDNKAEMRPEFERGERTAIERIVFQTVLDYALLPLLQRDRQAPRRLRDRVLKALRRGQDLDPWWFEEEAEEFLPWAREGFRSWGLDLRSLTVHVRHSDSEEDVSSVSLVDRELRERMVEQISEEPPQTLEGALRAEGLDEGDVEEIVALVAFKKARSHRAS
jgi:transcriptional regulator with XRE-family HTH domain